MPGELVVTVGGDDWGRGTAEVNRREGRGTSSPPSTLYRHLPGETFCDCSIECVGLIPAAGLPVSFTTTPCFCPETPIRWTQSKAVCWLIASLSPLE